MSISLSKIKKLPDQPGVYFFKAGREILYIGKATSLRDRVRSYFSIVAVAASRGARVAGLPRVATRVDFIATASVLEALILEAALIKKHQPAFNTKEKDDKSFLYVVITQEPWPRVLMVRGRQLEKQANFYRFTLKGSDTSKNFLVSSAVFGPFPHGNELKTALCLIRKIFPFRDKCLPESGRSCFNAQIGLCPGVCNGAISRGAYRKIISQLKLFLSGRKIGLVKKLQREMKTLARAKKFEEARVIRDRLFALEHIQDVALIKNKKETSQHSVLTGRIEAYDIAHLSGQETVGVMTVVMNGEGQPAEYRRFRIKGVAKNSANDVAALTELFTRRLNHPEWLRPSLVVVDGAQAQVNAAKKVLAARHFKLPVIGVVKNERHRPKRLLGPRQLLKDENLVKEILLANSEAHRFALQYHRRRRRLALRKLVLE